MESGAGIPGLPVSSFKYRLCQQPNALGRLFIYGYYSGPGEELKRHKFFKEVFYMERPGPHNDFNIPETIGNLHRPPGSPMPREIKSQKAQLESTHKHGDSKAIKISMSDKTGLREKKD